MQAFSCLLNSVSIFSYNFSHLFSVPFSCIHSCVFLVFWSTFGPLFFWKSPADIPVILNYLSRMFVYYCLVTICSDGLPSEGAAWWGHHLLSACQLTSSRFSCVCARACVCYQGDQIGSTWKWHFCHCCDGDSSILYLSRAKMVRVPISVLLAP